MVNFFKRNPEKRIVEKAGSRKGAALSFRAFAAAQVGRMLGPWKWDSGFSNDEVRMQLATVRSRSRDMYKNSPHHRRFCNLVATNVVGEGFTFKSAPHDNFPGMTNYRIDKTAAKFIEYHFWAWGNNPLICDTTGRKTVAEIDRLNAKTWARDGEYFLLVDTTAPNKYGMDLRVIRPDAVDERHNVNLANGNTVRCGVELDASSLRPVAYYLHTLKEYSTTVGASGPLRRVPASVDGSYGIIHGFTQEDEDQTRGMPLGHAGLTTLKMLEMWNEAELAAALDENCTVRTYHAPAGREGEIANLCDDENKETREAMTTPKEPGQAEILPQGWESTVNTPAHPNRETTAFKASYQRDYATAVNCEYANLCNDWSGVNYGSVRAGTLSERDMWMVMQQQMIGQCKSPVFHAWLRRFLSLPISGGFPLEKFDKFSEHEFRGRRWMWVDPLKDIKSAEVARAHGWKTDQQITSDFGGDFDDNVEEIQRSDTVVKGTSLETKNSEQKATAATVQK
jgi:lambda family phage portal protein